MASLTVGQRLDRLDVYLNNYIKAQKLPLQFKIKKIERARDAVFRGNILERDFLFRTTKVVADGDPYPVDTNGIIEMISYANNAYYTNGGVLTPFTFVNIQEIGQATNNSVAKGSAVSPKIYFSDLAIHTIPAGITGITFEYIQKPVALLTDPVDLTITDNMPEDLEDLITRMSFERTLKQLRSDKDLLEIAGLQEEEVKQASIRYYSDYYTKTKVDAQGEGT